MHVRTGRLVNIAGVLPFLRYLCINLLIDPEDGRGRIRDFFDVMDAQERYYTCI